MSTWVRFCKLTGPEKWFRTWDSCFLLTCDHTCCENLEKGVLIKSGLRPHAKVSNCDNECFNCSVLPTINLCDCDITVDTKHLGLCRLKIPRKQVGLIVTGFGSSLKQFAISSSSHTTKTFLYCFRRSFRLTEKMFIIVNLFYFLSEFAFQHLINRTICIQLNLMNQLTIDRVAIKIFWLHKSVISVIQPNHDRWNIYHSSQVHLNSIKRRIIVR